MDRPRDDSPGVVECQPCIEANAPKYVLGPSFSTYRKNRKEEKAVKKTEHEMKNIEDQFREKGNLQDLPLAHRMKALEVAHQHMKNLLRDKTEEEKKELLRGYNIDPRDLTERHTRDL